MAKADNETLLDKPLSKSFNSSEISFLASLLDDEIEDWIDDRRKKYEPLLADLFHLGNALASQGHDYGIRGERWWADTPPTVSPDLVINAICVCSKRLPVRVRHEGKPLQEWSLDCKGHYEGRSGRHLGKIEVDGVPAEDIHAKLIIQQVLAHHEEALLADKNYVLKANSKF